MQRKNRRVLLGVLIVLAAMAYFGFSGFQEGKAYYKTIDKFKVPGVMAKSIIKFEWRDLPTIPPDEEMSRWLTADYQRHKIVQRYRAQREAHA